MRVTSKLSDEFAQAEHIMVSNEVPGRVDLKIKNLNTLTKKDYRSDSKPTLGNNQRRGIHQIYQNIHLHDGAHNRPGTTHTERILKTKKVAASHQLNLDQDQFSSDIHNKTLTSEQLNDNHNENNIATTEQFSPKTV